MLTESSRLDHASRALTDAHQKIADAQARLISSHAVPPPSWLHPIRRMRSLRQQRSDRLVLARASSTLDEAQAVLIHAERDEPQDGWGVLRAGRATIDSALRQSLNARALARDRAIDRDCRDRIAQLQSRLASTRLQADDAHALVGVESDLLGIAVRVDERSESRRMLLNLLPARLRPVLPDVEQIEQNTRDVLVSVGETPDGIRLDQIVDRTGESRGLGTSLLQELCDYADHRGVFITCTLAEDPQRRLESTRLGLAGLYHRHGFASGDTPPEEWGPYEALTRAPQK